ncbi:hypothetical protein EBH_0008900 [Eimeria brunetti]|uniref:SAG family member n=1 Tax=Eimeria brunetti TaxID=51314 RepID=U6LCY2_9EIME|nr:hypothetical protein EBH_0008900 [Eimeria brunetti]
MAFYKTAAAVCLVALSGLQTAAGDTTYKFKAVDVDEVHINEVVKDESVVSTLKKKVEPTPTVKQVGKASENPRDAVMEANNLKDIFHYTFNYTAQPSYPELLQGALDAGLDVFKEEYFNALIARTAKLASMTEDDLKAPSNDGTAASAVPTILIAGLLAMLTAVAA